MFSVTETSRPNYYKYLARLNFECAEAADKTIGHLPGYKIAAPPPVMTLCAHSIELSLKAFLLESGAEESDVRALRHDLVTCWEKCKEVAKDGLPEIDESILAIISDLLISGRLRYGEESKLGRVPVYGPFQQLCRQCLELCGAPALSDLLR
jgi:hypothetical protein